MSTKNRLFAVVLILSILLAGCNFFSPNPSGKLLIENGGDQWGDGGWMKTVTLSGKTESAKSIDCEFGDNPVVSVAGKIAVITTNACHIKDLSALTMHVTVSTGNVANFESIPVPNDVVNDCKVSGCQMPWMNWYGEKLHVNYFYVDSKKSEAHIDVYELTGNEFSKIIEHSYSMNLYVTSVDNSNLSLSGSKLILFPQIGSQSLWSGVFYVLSNGTVREFGDKNDIVDKFTWSPDEENIFYEAVPETAPAHTQEYLKMVSVQKVTDPVIVASWGGSVDSFAVAKASFSPDGTKMAVAFEYPDQSYAFMIYEVMGQKTKLVNKIETGIKGDFVWSPDSQWIAFWGKYKGVSGVYAMRPNGTDVRMVMPEDNSANPSFLMGWFK